MGKYVTYASFDADVHDDTAFIDSMKAQLCQHVLDAGLHPLAEMSYTVAREWPRTVDPYDWLPRWRKALISIRLLTRPETFTVQNYGLRGVVQVAEDDPAGRGIDDHE